MNSIKIYRGNSLFTEIKPKTNSVQQKKIMGENEVRIDFESSLIVPFKIGDYTTIFGENYKINRLPIVNKLSQKRYSYSLVMQAEYYDLTKVQFLFYGSDNKLKEGDFSIMGNLHQFADLINLNISRVFQGWSIAPVPTSGFKNITFSNESVLEAISKIVENFELEYWIDGKKISFSKRAIIRNNVFRQGKGRGLYEINRQVNEQVDFVTRVYAFGGDKNIPNDYRDYSKRLKIAEKDPCLISNLLCTDISTTNDGRQRYVFSWVEPDNNDVNAITINYRPIGSNSSWESSTGSKTGPREVLLIPGLYEFNFESKAPNISPCDGKKTSTIPITTPFNIPLFQGQLLPYVEANIDKYGIIERTVVFEDIFPSRVGRVSSVNDANPFEFTDTDIDFDINSYLLPGIVAKVTFNSGQLAGYTFELSSFNNSTKKFFILKNKNENQMDLPSSLIRPAIGDLYVLTDIRMPIQYIEAAEQKLLDAAIKYLSSNSEPSYTFTIVFDPMYLKINRIMPVIGELYFIVDDELELNNQIRVTSTTRNLVNEYELSIEMSDVLVNGTIQRLASSISNVNSSVRSVSSDFQNNNLIQNNKTVGDFRIEQGTIVAKDMKEKNASGTYKQLFIDEVTGEFYRG